MNITKCRVNHIQNPMGYRIGVPVFSWVTENATGKRQKAARLRVWEGAAEGALLYDSGWGALNSLGTEVEINLMNNTIVLVTIIVVGGVGALQEWVQICNLAGSWK